MKRYLLVALSILALLGACASEGDGGKAAEGPIEVTVENGEASGDTEATVSAGTEVTIEVTSDTDGTIHVHGYDLREQVSAGETAAVDFTADIPGVFEIEMEETHLLLVELTVE